MKILATALLLITSAAVYGQYITVDRDGYTNIRESADAGSRIIGRVERHEIFFCAGDFCTNDTLNFDHVPSEWMAVTKGQWEPIGYMYRKNIRSFDDLRQLVPQQSPETPYKIVCIGDQMKITLELERFDPDKHAISLLDEGDENVLVCTIDGQYPKGISGFFNKDGTLTSLSEDGDKEITGLVIDYPGQRISLPVDAIKDFFNPQMCVFVGVDNELYVWIGSGDGGEAYSIILSVVDGVIRYISPADLC